MIVSGDGLYSLHTKADYQHYEGSYVDQRKSLAGYYRRLPGLLVSPPAMGTGDMSEENEDDERQADESGPLAGWLLNKKQKSFIRSLLPEDDEEEPDADPPPDKTWRTSLAM